PHRLRLSFPTRRSSDLSLPLQRGKPLIRIRPTDLDFVHAPRRTAPLAQPHDAAHVRHRVGKPSEIRVIRLPVLARPVPDRTLLEDRKSTRLNSSHVKIS